MTGVRNVCKQLASLLVPRVCCLSQLIRPNFQALLNIEQTLSHTLEKPSTFKRMYVLLKETGRQKWKWQTYTLLSIKNDETSKDDHCGLAILTKIISNGFRKKLILNLLTKYLFRFRRYGNLNYSLSKYGHTQKGLYGQWNDGQMGLIEQHNIGCLPVRLLLLYWNYSCLLSYFWIFHKMIA